MRKSIMLVVWSLLWMGVQAAENRSLPYGPVVIPLVLEGFEALDEDRYLRVEYCASPEGRVLAVEEAEKIWFFNDVAVVLLGATGRTLPEAVTARATAWVQLFDGHVLLGEYGIHPRRDRVRIDGNREGIVAALSRQMAGVNATYIAQVANYLAGNVATLDVMGSTYCVDGVGTVINEAGEWVGAPTGYWSMARGGHVWTARESDRQWRGVDMSADGTIQTAVVNGGQIYVSTDTGLTWTARDSNRSWYGVAMSADGAIQTAVVYGGQIYVSTDTGATWTARESDRDWYGVAMSADGMIQSACIEGGQIYVSMDAGASWTARASVRWWRNVAISADGSIQTGVVLDSRIFMSTDTGETWYESMPSARFWWDVEMSADGTIQTAVGHGGQIYVSTDTGVNWTARDSNRDWYGVAMSSDGTIQTAVDKGGQIYLSTDTGVSWTARESDREWYDVAMSADGTIQTAVVEGGQIYVSVPGIGVVDPPVGIGTLDPTEKLEVIGNVHIDGDLSFTGACPDCASDRALKTSIQPLDHALEKITALKGVSFRWNEGTRQALDHPNRQIGVVAQDVETVFPELVGIDSKGYKYVHYQKLVVPLIEAMKILKDQADDRQIQIEQLEEIHRAEREEFNARIQALEGRIQ